MKYIDEFRDKRIVKGLLKDIALLSDRKYSFMEVCGTHTMAIFRSGIKNILPSGIELISGPGCPVCVTAQEDIDAMLSLSRNKNVIITSFGDMLKVPGTGSTLERERASGADIRTVYSPLDALAIAGENTFKEVVFLAVGFETTAPAIASAVADAKKNGIKNFSLYPCNKTIPRAMKTLLAAKEIRIDGFLCPGHVSSIIGSKAYDFIVQDHNIPCVVSGFEPIDILETVLALLRLSSSGKPAVEIQYKRAVKPEGNLRAVEMIGEVFEQESASWRGLGNIPGSGLKLRGKYAAFDARTKFKIKISSKPRNGQCSCPEILRGVKNPPQCKLFAKACTPENPYGPCMVSSEGTCAAWYKYGR